MNTDKPEVRVAVLDLYEGVANEGMRGFRDILERYKGQHNLDLTYQIFDVRLKGQVPDTSFDVYISSGGPGSPLNSEGTEWEKKYFRLIDKLEAHNKQEGTQKKHVFFVCHSFQLMCRRYNLGDIALRRSPSFGVLPVHLTEAGRNEQVFEGLSDPFYTVDSRSWQVIKPDMDRIEKLGMKILALEKERPHVKLPQALMAIRFNEYFFATQFHPEADAHGMSVMLQREDKKDEVINEHGEAKYKEMLERLEDPDKIVHTQKTIIPNFLDEAILSFCHAER
ncbi:MULTISPECIES: GMP synthase [unclassified Mucilaginibacter]|uniref:type 1 glutamine amidotransferase n=1 Tax=unclassified Mucilaginibacter TaxID=2617802 RepID=UPI002AC9519C|nr:MULTISPECIES: GMP synthase [unclassified Mucilaginibacter]MEB0249028.1 GMP synthase [Mucilaginibacter sp. 5B2]MEB0263503.1 GMP synthase [Mucilaginibacter sp. 10I4]MEB0278598.1 GMP synthase [Mucilaginibacter sp. 10B2]MEB0299308.1 GMP synthase [Mucilaginibacter sp. 5C4]WPX23447.1 GMP synthase [Mucilaginibacter sp. 5C4]